MFRKPQKNQDYSLAKQYIEKYITNPDLKLVGKKIKEFWNILQGKSSRPEELFITAKIEERDIHFTKVVQIRDYLQFKISYLKSRINQYIFLIQGITIFLVIDLLVNLLLNNFSIMMLTTIIASILFLIGIYYTIQIFSSNYLVFQYRLIKTYFEQKEVDNYLETKI